MIYYEWLIPGIPISSAVDRKLNFYLNPVVRSELFLNYSIASFHMVLIGVLFFFFFYFRQSQMTQKGTVVLLTLQEKLVVWKRHFTLFNNFTSAYRLFDRK